MPGCALRSSLRVVAQEISAEARSSRYALRVSARQQALRGA